MSVTKRAIIDWIRKEDGGRSAPPPGPQYLGVVELPPSEFPTGDAWSLVVDMIHSEGPYRWLADIRFLSPEAPHDWLESSEEFELYEGKKCVARGRPIQGKATVKPVGGG